MARKPFDPTHSTVFRKSSVQPFKVQKPSQPRTSPEQSQRRANHGIAPPPPPPLPPSQFRIPPVEPAQPEPPVSVPLAEPEISVTPPTPVASAPAKRGNGWRWCLVWLSLTAFCGGTGVSALLWLSTVPPLPDCKQVSLLAADADRLYCIQQQAKSGKLEDLMAGFALVQSWSKEHPLYTKAQTSMKEWSQTILNMAQQKINQDDLKGAIALAEKIPSSSPLRKQATTRIATWKQDWQKGEAIYQQVQKSIKAQKWQQAWTQSEALSDLQTEEWRDRLNDLRQQIMAEKQARLQFQQAQSLVSNGSWQVEKLGQALVLVRQIDAKRYVYKEAQAKANEWSRTLVDIAINRVQQQDMRGAIAAVLNLPTHSALPPELRDLVWFGRAQQLITPKQIIRQPLLTQMWELSVTLPVIARMPKESLFYPQAQSYIPQLKKQLQDLLQLHFANSLANFGQIPSLEIAIRYAEAIAPDRPGRLYAQTMIAQWRKDIQRIEDRPYLLRAQELAKAGQIPDLRAAIAEAQKIAIDRALRPEAQAAIFGWNRQIQRIEDQPVLDLARALAKQGELAKAIQTAEKIRPKRVLYQEAQSAIQGWVVEIQIAEDRPILSEAWALADRGRLTMAIDLAAKISPDRALYSEAQSAISEWMVKRAAIYREWAITDENSDADRPYSDVAPPETSPPESSEYGAESFPYPDALRNSDTP
jgi:hypothetical protein